MMFSESKQWVLVGLTSYLANDSEANASSLYTRVAFFRDWIQLKTNEPCRTSTNTLGDRNSTAASSMVNLLGWNDAFRTIKQRFTMHAPASASSSSIVIPRCYLFFITLLLVLL